MSNERSFGAKYLVRDEHINYLKEPERKLTLGFQSLCGFIKDGGVKFTSFETKLVS